MFVCRLELRPPCISPSHRNALFIRNCLTKRHVTFVVMLFFFTCTWRVDLRTWPKTANNYHTARSDWTERNTSSWHCFKVASIFIMPIPGPNDHHFKWFIHWNSMRVVPTAALQNGTLKCLCEDLYRLFEYWYSVIIEHCMFGSGFTYLFYLIPLYLVCEPGHFSMWYWYWKFTEV